MQITKTNKSTGLLIDLRLRTKGEMTDEKTGKLVKWGDAKQVVMLPLDSTDGYAKKLTIREDLADLIEAKLADAHWGAVIEVTLEGREIIDVQIILDALAALYAD